MVLLAVGVAGCGRVGYGSVENVLRSDAAGDAGAAVDGEITRLDGGTMPSDARTDGGSADSSTDANDAAADGGTCSRRVDVLGLGWSHTCVVAEGALYCWGANHNGSLGLGDRGPGTERLTPTRVGAWNDWTFVNAGNTHSCGLRAGGALYCWGGGEGLVPTEVMPGSRWRFVAMGANSICAIRDTGTLWCWGTNLDGEVGTGDTTERVAPVQVSTDTTWTQVGTGIRHTCGLNGGTVYCWGGNAFGQLGLGDTMPRLEPTAVVSGKTDLLVGANSSCARTGAGDVSCWGSAVDFGGGTTTPAPLGGTWLSLSPRGGDHACGFQSDGAWCFGRNHRAQLGLGFESTREPPTRLPMMFDVVDPAANHTCALRGGELWCWGQNENGQVGVGTFSALEVTPARICVP